MTREEWLKALIQEQYRSLLHFSKSIGMNYTTLQKLLSTEDGISRASFGTIERICKGTGLSMDEIMDKKASAHKGAYILTDEHEKELVLAYRQNPEMRKAVDKILGVD